MIDQENRHAGWCPQSDPGCPHARCDCASGPSVNEDETETETETPPSFVVSANIAAFGFALAMIAFGMGSCGLQLSKGNAMEIEAVAKAQAYKTLADACKQSMAMRAQNGATGDMKCTIDFH